MSGVRASILHYLNKVGSKEFFTIDYSLYFLGSCGHLESQDHGQLPYNSMHGYSAQFCRMEDLKFTDKKITNCHKNVIDSTKQFMVGLALFILNSIAS